MNFNSDELVKILIEYIRKIIKEEIKEYLNE